MQEYTDLLDRTVLRAVAWQTDRGHPDLPHLTLFDVAEQAATTTVAVELALRFGTLADANDGLQDDKLFKEVTRSLGERGMLTYVVARVVFKDAKRRPMWQAYIKENEHRWVLPKTSE